MKLHGPGGGEIFIGPHLLLPADKVRHVGEAVAMVVAEIAGPGARCRRSGNVSYEPLPCVTAPKRPCSPPHLQSGTKFRTTSWSTPGSATRPRRGALSSCRAHRHQRFPVGRVTGAPMEPRAAVAHYDETGTATRFMPAAAGRSGKNASSLRCSGSSPTKSACSPMTSAAISARAIASMSNSGSCCGPPASSDGRSNTPPRVRNVSSATTRAAIWWRSSSWHLMQRGRFLACAQPISAMSAPAVFRFRL